MKSCLFILFLFLCFSAFAQQTPYQAFDVDSAAEPRGGMAYLTTFIQANLRKPIAAEAVGTSGLVIVGGTVEPDGHITNVTVMKSLRPDCDREAARVFRLFNAWKPAQRGGKLVRQQVSIPVRFTPNTPFAYMNGTQILYLTADLSVLTDSTKRVKFKQISPVDTNGLPNGDLVVFKLVNNKWEEYTRDSLVRRPNGQTDGAEKPVFSVGHQLAMKGLSGCQYIVSASGGILSEQCYKAGKPVGLQLIYHLNGVLARRNEEIGSRRISTLWYANGQIQQVQETNISGPLDPFTTKFIAFWDSTGQQFVKNGDGSVKNAPNIRARYDKGDEVFVQEQGTYKDYLKHGTWTGRSVDNAYYYEEQYNNGVLLSGKSYINGQDTTLYNVEDRPPTFPGGTQGLGRFLGDNLQYPADAQRSGAQGTVLLGFSVCTDGTLCDYTVLKSVHPNIDKEALRVVQKTSGRWQPAIQDGKKVKVRFVMPVNFHLQ